MIKFYYNNPVDILFALSHLTLGANILLDTLPAPRARAHNNWR